MMTRVLGSQFIFYTIIIADTIISDAIIISDTIKSGFY